MFFLALRHLLSKKRQTFLILFGISLGSMIYVAISGLQLGFREFIIDQLVNNDAHIRISAKEEIISEESMVRNLFPDREVLWVLPPSGRRDETHINYPQGWFDRLLRDPEVLAYAPQLKIQILINRGHQRLTSQFVGVLPEHQKRVTTLENYITEGSLDSLSGGGNQVIIGQGLLKKLGARKGETLLISSGLGEPRPFKIVGIFQLGVEPIDNGTLFGSLRDVQQLNQSPGRISDIAVRLVDVTKAAEIATTWSILGQDRVQSWDQANQNFLQVFKIQDAVRFIITIAILIVASFGIYNVLSIMISQKRKEIAILRSMGFDPRDILELFLIQGAILGFLGAILGLGFGYLLCWGLEQIDLNLMGRKGFIISYGASIYVVGFVMAVVASLLAAFIPARAASRLTPIDIIRSEV